MLAEGSQTGALKPCKEPPSHLEGPPKPGQLLPFHTCKHGDPERANDQDHPASWWPRWDQKLDHQLLVIPMALDSPAPPPGMQMSLTQGPRVIEPLISRGYRPSAGRVEEECGDV